MASLNSLALLGLVLCLLGSLTSAGKGPVDASLATSDVDTIVTHVLTLKEAVDASAKEQWEALQSLRFHMLSARTGLKQALEELEALKQQVAECRAARPSLEPEDKGDDHDNKEEETAAPTTTTPSPGCRWPSEDVGGRCLVLVTDQIMTWEDAQQHCSNLGGSLAGKENFDTLRDYLTGQFGVNSELRVRWEMWAGARQTLSGWEWASRGCSSDPVLAEVWAANQPRATAPPNVTLACMAMDGFESYSAVSVPCTALRRFVCDLS